MTLTRFVVPTGAERSEAERRDLLSATSRFSLKEGPSAPRVVYPERSRGALRSIDVELAEGQPLRRFIELRDEAVKM